MKTVHIFRQTIRLWGVLFCLLTLNAIWIPTAYAEQPGTNQMFSLNARYAHPSMAELSPCVPISFGSSLAGAITPVGEEDCYTFSGSAGDKIRLRIVETSGFLNAEGEIMDCVSTTIMEQTCVLTSSGSHTILVRDYSGANTGNYSIYVQRLNAPLSCTSISFGSVLTGAINPAGEADCFTFSGTAGDQVRLRVVETSGYLNANVEIIAPSGSTVCDSTTLMEQTCLLNSTGSHTILVRDYSGPNTGNYSIQLGITTSIDIKVGGVVHGNYELAASESQRVSYVNINSGPVQIQNLNAHSVIASQRVIYGGWSYSEMMGLPNVRHFDV